LRQDFINKRWNVLSNSSINITLSNTDFKKSIKPDKTERYKLPDGLVIVSAIINPELLRVNKALKVYVFNYSCHIFVNFTILNNSAVINFVNDKIKLELRSFIRIINLKAIIEYSILRLLIVN
jgi:hypothetical protein